jgi:hypothetical protein
MTDVAEGYNYWLAIEDFVPVVFGAIGFYALTQRARGRFPELTIPVAFAGVILVIGSSFAGSIRKAFLAEGVSESSLDWMQIPFFSAMPIGFGILFWAMLCLVKDRKLSFLPFGILIAVLFALASFAERSIILIASGGLLAVATGLTAAVLAKRQGSTLTSVLFVLYSVVILALPALGASENREDVAHQWLEQGTNTVAQGLFALAAYRLLSEYRRTADRSSVPVEA